MTSFLLRSYKLQAEKESSRYLEYNVIETIRPCLQEITNVRLETCSFGEVGFQQSFRTGNFGLDFSTALSLGWHSDFLEGQLGDSRYASLRRLRLAIECRRASVLA